MNTYKILNLCDCTGAGPDGRPDLMLHFDKPSIVRALNLTSVPDGQLVQIEITGKLRDRGTVIKGRDCARKQ